MSPEISPEMSPEMSPDIRHAMSPPWIHNPLIRIGLLGRSPKPQAQGFTLVELVVAVMIMGILAAIALPTLLNQSNRARQAEAINIIGAINRAQAAQYHEKGDFADSIGTLGVGLIESDRHYTYAIIPPEDNAPWSITEATPKNLTLRGYTGVVYMSIESTNIPLLTSVLCSGTPGAVPALTISEISGEVDITSCNEDI